VASLTQQQMSFLRSQNIPMSSLFDASGMKRTDYQSTMKAEGKSFAYGVTPCNAEGHTLRTRAGHCIQCDHSKIAFMLRSDAQAYIYIAASVAGRLIKIGSTIDISDRKDKLNRYKYGDQKDWQILASARNSQAGRVEAKVHTRLSQYWVPGEYYPAGKRQKCYELFRCNFTHARDALRAELGKASTVHIPEPERAEAAFQFLG